MKKHIVLAAAGISLCASVFAQSITLTNTFGGNTNSTCGSDTGGEDFITFSKQDDDTYSNTQAHVSDRLQLDFSSKKFDGRLRTEIKTGKLTDPEPEIKLTGYVRFRPIEQLGFAAGNSFFTKYVVSSAFLAAANDYPSYGKMADNGFAVISNIGGLTLAGNISGDSIFNNNESFKLNFGAQYAIPDAVSFGATFRSVTNGNFSTGVFAGLECVKNLILNVGFIYNSTETKFAYEPSKYTLQASAGYTIPSAKLGFYADVATGLNNEYLSPQKEGEKITGYETKEHKDGSGDDYVPLQARARLVFDVTDTIALNGDVKVRTKIGADETETTVYPYINIKLDKFGTLDAGIRMRFTNDDGLASFSIPLAWKCKLVDKKFN